MNQLLPQVQQPQHLDFHLHHDVLYIYGLIIQLYMDLHYITYICFIHYWNKYVITMHDIDKIEINITNK